MPSNIVLRNLTPKTVKANSAPVIATRSDLRDGSRTGSGGIDPGPAPGPQRITGTGFGAGPNVVLFGSMDGVAGELVQVTDADIGTWAATRVKASGAVDGARFYTKNNKTWLAGRDSQNLNSSDKLMTGVRAAVAPTDKFRLAYKLAAADGHKMPGAASVGGSPSDANASVFKTVWVDHDGGYANDSADVCLPTWLGSGWTTLSGNSIRPVYEDGGTQYINLAEEALDFNAGENLISYVSGEQESSPGASDGVASLVVAVQSASKASWSYNRYATADPFNPVSNPVNTKLWSEFCFPGWYGNSGFVGVLPLFRDMYIATGDNCEACLILSDAPTLSASKAFAIIPPDTWTDTEITYSPRSYDPDYRHLILADGAVLENV